MAYELTGTIVAKFDTQVISDRFKKREFVVETREAGSAYSNFVKLQLTQNKCEIIEGYNVGDDVKVSFDIRGNRYEKNGTVGYITNLDAWRISNAGAPGNAATPAAQVNAAPQAQVLPDAPSSFVPDAPFDDDLPF